MDSNTPKPATRIDRWRAAAVSTAALGLVLAGCGGPGPEAGRADREAPTPAQLEEARALAGSFMERLKGELQTALREGGPAAAIGVCRTRAPGIAGELSRERDWAVGRTALRVRNPRNAPSPRERAVLMRFLQRAEAGEDLAGMEHAAVVHGEGEPYLHYMKAIPTGGLCLTCHGEALALEVEEVLHEMYPSDAATGFREGELRGAFTFVKPLPSDGQRGAAGP